MDTRNKNKPTGREERGIKDDAIAKPSYIPSNHDDAKRYLDGHAALKVTEGGEEDLLDEYRVTVWAVPYTSDDET